ncbi:MAG: MotA/TolQ/ExbB proton channel family protein [Planctomycetota bacterium]|jgi:biopolymer transport protein ExbB
MTPHWIAEGGPIMYALIGCSMLSVTVAAERAVYWGRRGRSRDQRSIDESIRLVRAGRHAEARERIAGSEDPLGRIIHAGLIREDGDDAVEALEMAARRDARSMRSYLRVLDTIVTVAPLLGILGTVLGIITAFDVLGGGGIDNPIEVTGGISEALLTTAAGLVVAIIALLPYNYFTARMEDAVGELEGHLTPIENALRRQVVE